MASSILTRSSFDNQNLIYLLLHFSSSSKGNRKNLDILSEALREILAVAASVAGTPRIPGFGLGYLSDQFIEVVSLTPVKGCLDAIFQKIEKIHLFCPPDTGENLGESIKEALSFIQLKYNEFSAPEHQKIKIILMTASDSNEAAQSMSNEVKHFLHLPINSIEVYKTINIVNSEKGGFSPIIGSGQDPIETSGGFRIYGNQIPMDPYSIRIVFKQWLCEEAGKMPHLILTFASDSSKRALHFDQKESLIDPNLLPSVIGSKLLLPLTSSRTTTTTTGAPINVSELEAVHVISFQSLSANWIYGSLVYLVPSAAKQLNFQEFWDNSLRADALYYKLKENDEGLICRMSTTSNPSINSYFVIFALYEALGLASLVPTELALCESFRTPHEVPRKYRDQVEEVMKGLEKSDFKIDIFNSKLTSALVHHTSRNSKTRISGTPARMVRPMAYTVTPGRPRGMSNRAQIHPCLQNPRTFRK